MNQNKKNEGIDQYAAETICHRPEIFLIYQALSQTFTGSSGLKFKTLDRRLRLHR